jgi:hypothetical protein
VEKLARTNRGSKFCRGPIDRTRHAGMTPFPRVSPDDEPDSDGFYALAHGRQLLSATIGCPQALVSWPPLQRPEGNVFIWIQRARGSRLGIRLVRRLDSECAPTPPVLGMPSPVANPVEPDLVGGPGPVLPIAEVAQGTGLIEVHPALLREGRPDRSRRPVLGRAASLRHHRPGPAGVSAAPTRDRHVHR